MEIPLRRPEEMMRFGAPLPRGLLLYGPSGVGKTKLLNAIVNEIKCHAVWIQASDSWSSKYPSENESRLEEWLSSAWANAPSLIVLDDVDALCPKRKEKSGGGENERRLRSAL